MTDLDLQTKLKDAMKGVTTELGKRGIPYEEGPVSDTTMDRSLKSVGGCYVPVEIKAERGSAMARSKGKIRIQVGNYGHRKQFPERRGGFDFTVVADSIEEFIKAQKAGEKHSKARSDIRSGLDEALSRIKERLGQPMTNVDLRVDPYLHGLTIELTNLTEERANDVLDAIRKVFASS